MQKIFRIFGNLKNITEVMAKETSELLNGGFQLLKHSHPLQRKDVKNESGNYIITISDRNYSGQAMNLKERISTHIHPKSTLYKSFSNELGRSPDLTDFEIRCTKVLFGKKELEEFAMANLTNVLNKLNKSAQRKHEDPDTTSSIAHWSKIQSNEQALQSILRKMKNDIEQIPFLSWSDAAQLAECFKNIAGIYIIRDNNGRILYVGESSKLHIRYDRHSKTTRFSIFRRNVATQLLNLNLITVQERGRPELSDTKRWYLSHKETQIQ
jgi:predicted GIY-YIG superfamily endonuclease